MAPWQSFYVMLGSSAAALIGPQFVVVALTANVRRLANASTMHAFGTPTVAHPGGALIISAIMSAPWPTPIRSTTRAVVGAGYFLNGAGQALSTVTALVEHKSSFPWVIRGVAASLLQRYGMNKALDPHGPAPDIIVSNLSGTDLYAMTPCHSAAAEWLMSVVGDMPVDDRCIEDTILDALTAGFNLSFAFEGQSRVLDGLGLN